MFSIEGLRGYLLANGSQMDVTDETRRSNRCRPIDAADVTISCLAVLTHTHFCTPKLRRTVQTSWANRSGSNTIAPHFRLMANPPILTIEVMLVYPLCNGR